MERGRGGEGGGGGGEGEMYRREIEEGSKQTNESKKLL